MQDSQISKQEQFIQELEQKANQKKTVSKRETKIKPDVKSESTPEAKTFRMISKITPQKAKGRYNIFINDEFAFGVDEEVLIKYSLNKGLHITPELQKEIESEESYFKAYQRTLNYLSYSLRSEKQIKDYLIKHEVEQYTDRMIEQFRKMKLLDDLNYAKSYVRTMANINRKGLRNIEQDLKQKGISDSDILTALEEYPYEQQMENALILAEKKWKGTQNKSTFEGIQKVKQYLVNKGYSFEIAEEVIDQMDTEKDKEAEYKGLVKQATTAERRYARKHEGYELSQKIKSYLYTKRYSTELINRYMDEREME